MAQRLPMIPLPRRLPLCAALALLAGCAPQVPINTAPTGTLTTIRNVKYNGVSYPTPAAALEAERSADNRFAEGVSAERDPIKGRVRIIVPDMDRLRPLVTQELQQQLKRPVGGQVVEFYTQERHVGTTSVANALLKAREFQSGTVIEQNDVADPAQGDADYLVWYQVRTLLPNNTGAWIGHWLVRRTGSPMVAPANFDLGTAAGSPRYDSFVKSVREAALRLGGASLAGVTSSSLRPGVAAGSGTIGSGIVIDAKGHVLTNAHVVRACTQPKIIDSANHSYDATIAARDTVNDLALLTTTHHWPDAATLRDGQESRPGDALVVTGYPLAGLLGSGMTVTTGSLSALTGLGDDSRMLQISAPVQPGNSGGPVLDESGRLVGMVTASLNGIVMAVVTGQMPQNVNFAIKTAIIRNFLDTRQIDYAHNAPAHDLPPGEVGELARKFTVRVECRRP